MLFDELSCEAICDGIHLSGPAIKLLWKNKPVDKFILITDAMRAKHMPDGVSELGGQLVIVKNGEARLENGTLAGSVLRMNNAVKNVMVMFFDPGTHIPRMQRFPLPVYDLSHLFSGGMKDKLLIVKSRPENSAFFSKTH